MAKKYYAVKAGRQTGIFTTWAECQRQVTGYPGAKFKGFATQAEATSWLTATARPVAASQPEISEATVRLYTDGGSRNHGNKLGQHVKSDDKAAWAYLIEAGGHRYEGTAGELGATNNKMEITALLMALERLQELGLQNESILAILDSHYVLDPIMKGWLRSWQRRGWKTAAGKPVANKDLWVELLAVLPLFPALHFDWTKGHASNAGNNRVDELLNQTMDKMN
ncbi:ribonuclease H family protein [Limosilactobacillus caccae]|jgi:ribonuclease HI|uniref:ribonuclease H family protein n=1 Tax=Limosilactobacillus caccae TaxID=1926284 RepID=UPI000970531D|nr:ribonuclease H family protein [Limosilactobacillus caccae]